MSIDIDAIEARADAATPGPWMWEISEYSACLFGHNQKSDHPLQLIKAPIKSDEFACYWPNAQDAAFIAASRHDVPALCAELRRLRAELADVRAQWQADVGSAIARAQTAEARVTAMELERDAARAEAARLRKLLTRNNLPFAGTNAFVIGPGFCLWCGRSEPDHFDNCEYDAALRGPAQSEQTAERRQEANDGY